MALSVGLWRTPLVCVGLMRWPRSSKIGKFGLTDVAHWRLIASCHRRPLLARADAIAE